MNITRADNPGQPTDGHRTSHGSPTGGHRGGHDTFCGGQGLTTDGEKFHVVYKILQKSWREPLLILFTLQHLPLHYQLL